MRCCVPPALHSYYRQPEAFRHDVLTLRDNAARVTTMREFHAWLYGTHMCYAVARQGEWGAEKPAMQDAALASY